MQEQPTPQLPTIVASDDSPLAQVSSSALVLGKENMQQIIEFADFMSKGRSTLPKHLQGSPADCAAVVTQAMQWRMNPYAVAQKTHLVNGVLGYEAQLVNAVINSLAPTKDRLHYDWFGDWSKVIGRFTIKKKKGDDGFEKEYRIPGWTMADEEGLGVRVWATLKGEDEPRELELLLAQASVRNSPLWATDPKQQLAYLGVKRWSRLYCPDVILGVYTPDEIETQPMKDLNDRPAGRPTNARPAAVAASRQQAPAGPSEKLLKEARAAADKGTDAFGVFWKGIKPADRGALRPEVADLQQRCETADQASLASAARHVPQPGQQSQASQADIDDFVADMDRANGVAPGDDDYTPE
jgi:hypothetical protein